MGTRAQGLFAHATTLGAPAIVVTQAHVARYKNICASDPENVCTLLAALQGLVGNLAMLRSCPQRVLTVKTAYSPLQVFISSY